MSAGGRCSREAAAWPALPAPRSPTPEKQVGPRFPAHPDWRERLSVRAAGVEAAPAGCWGAGACFLGAVAAGLGSSSLSSSISHGPGGSVGLRWDALFSGQVTYMFRTHFWNEPWGPSQAPEWTLPKNKWKASLPPCAVLRRLSSRDFKAVGAFN